MFNSRGMCQTLRTGAFINTLQVNGLLEVNNIVANNGSNTVSITGYPAVDDLIVVDYNLSEAILALNAVNFAFVADRDYELVSATVIYSEPGGVDAEVMINKLFDNDIILNFVLDGPPDVPVNVVYGANNLVKGNAIRLTGLGDTTGLGGCVVSIVLRQN